MLTSGDTPDAVARYEVPDDVAPFNVDIAFAELMFWQRKFVFLVTGENARVQVALGVVQVLQKIVSQNHGAILPTTDVRKPPANGRRMASGCLSVLVNEVLQLAQVVRQIAENGSGIEV